MYINLLVLDFPILATNAKSIRRKCLGTMVRKCCNAVNKPVKIWSGHGRDRDPCKGGCKCKTIKESSLICFAQRNAAKRAWRGEDLETELCKLPLLQENFVAHPKGRALKHLYKPFPLPHKLFFLCLSLPLLACPCKHCPGCWWRLR